MQENITFVSIQNHDEDGACVWTRFTHGMDLPLEDYSILSGTVLIIASSNPVTNCTYIVNDSTDCADSFLGWYFNTYTKLKKNNTTVYVTPEAIMSSYNALSEDTRSNFFSQHDVIKNEHEFIEALKSSHLYFAENLIMKPVLNYASEDAKQFINHLIWKSEHQETIEPATAEIHALEPAQAAKKGNPFIRFIFTMAFCAMALFLGYRMFQKQHMPKKRVYLSR